MQRKLDESRFLIQITKKLSTFLAANRGIPILIGIFLVAFGFVIALVNHFAPNRDIELVGIIVHHGGLLLALIGILLAEPLGK